MCKLHRRLPFVRCSHPIHQQGRICAVRLFSSYLFSLRFRFLILGLFFLSFIAQPTLSALPKLARSRTGKDRARLIRAVCISAWTRMRTSSFLSSSSSLHATLTDLVSFFNSKHEDATYPDETFSSTTIDLERNESHGDKKYPNTGSFGPDVN